MNSEILEEKEAQNEVPSINSSDPNERKLARRLRLKRRLEAAEKARALASGEYEEEEPEKPLIDETIETCEDTLRILWMEGDELVSNVRVASDAKEVERREIAVQEGNLRLDKLREDSALALEKLNEISNKWEAIVETSGPLELYQHMKDQKAKCLDLIQQKNDLIKGFQMELKVADEKFMKDIKSMYEELSLLTKRIDEQVLRMKRAYRLEMDGVEESVDKTRAQLIEKHSKVWLSLYNQREKDEVTNMNKKFNMVENFHEELEKLHLGNEEKYRETRIQLETDIEMLELELEQVKALCLLNSEKLDYNYQVLRKREEENVYIKNHQKRRLNKLQDLVNSLKKKIDSTRHSAEEERKKLVREVQRYHANMIQTKKKSERLTRVNDDTFQNIWDMKDEEARELVEKIIAANLVIHEQILEVPWVPPPTTFPMKEDLPSYKAALNVLHSVEKSEAAAKEAKNKKKLSTKGSKENDTSHLVVESQRNLIRQILELVADQSGFLMEEKLNELLKPYTDVEKTFVCLDNVFLAIGIQGDYDQNLALFKKIFFPYTVCLICDAKTSSLLLTEETQNEDIEIYNKVAGGSKQSVLQMRELEEKVSRLRIQAKKIFSSDTAVANNLEKIKMTANEIEASHGRIDEKDSGAVFQMYDSMIEKNYPLDHRQGSNTSSRHMSSIESEDFSVKKRDSPRFSETHDGEPQAHAQVTASVNVESVCNITHPLYIEKHNVLKAMKDLVSEFVSEKNHLSKQLDQKTNQIAYSISRLMRNEDISIHWEKYKKLLPNNIEITWNAILIALTRYLYILKDRHKLNLKVEAIRRQNMEMKKLLAYYRRSHPKRESHLLPTISSLPDEPIDPRKLAAIAEKLKE